MPDRYADLRAWGLSEGVARRVAERERVRPSGPVRDPRSEEERRAALMAEQDRLARQRPLERLLGSLPTDAQPPSTLWDRLNAPTVSLPRATTRSLDDAGSDLVRNAGTLGATLRGIRDIGGQAVNTAAEVVEGASSPMSLAMMAASGGASLAGKAGLLGISQGARVLEAGLSAPYVGHGLATMAQADTPAEVILGGLEAAGGGFGVRQAAKHAFPIPRVAAAYMQERGLPLEMPRLIKKTDERFAMRVADAYEAMQDAPNDPAVARAYAKMAEEASDQFRFIVSRAGVKTEAWRKPKQPYANSAEMLADIEQNNHLWYFPSESGFGQTDTVLATNPLLQPGKSGLPVNDEFRVVHDYFGHGRSRAQFGPVGEENATRTHETMFTPEARDAMITETRGQNSWVNFGPQMRRPDGTLIRKGEPGWLDPTKRAYADQRAGLLGAVARTPAPALAIVGPAAAQGVPDDPESEWDNALRAALYGTTVAAATAGWFPKKLGTELMGIKRGLAVQAKASGEPLLDAVVNTAVRNHIRSVSPDAKTAQRLIDGFETIALPTFEGVNFDSRRAIDQVLKFDAPGTSTTSGMKGERGAMLADWSRKRMNVAYAKGELRNDQWGDPRWLFNLVDGDPQKAVQVTRLLGAFSPGQKTDANALNAIEAFLRASSGESTSDILKSLSFGHPRPNTVTANMDRAMQLGRIFQQKTEALAGAELGIHDAIPIDMWLLRALGVQSDTTPPSGAYRLLSEAISKEAAAKGEEAFPYMAKVWMGMQDIVGTPTPSFAEAVSSLKLPSTIGTQAGQEQARGMIGQMSKSMLQARRSAREGTAQVGISSPITNNPLMPFDEFLTQAQALMRKGIAGGDVLGRVTTPAKRTNVSLRSFVQGRGER